MAGMVPTQTTIHLRSSFDGIEHTGSRCLVASYFYSFADALSGDVMGCDFCDRQKEGLKDRIVAGENKEKIWYTLVPNDPHIFGHILLTIDRNTNDEKYHVRDFWKIGDKEVLKEEIYGVVESMVALKRIPCVERIYLVVAGESETLHHHYHLIPRYKVKCNWASKDYGDWTKQCRLENIGLGWGRFYDMPKSFCHSSGFQYLGELERTYNHFKECVTEKSGPGLSLLREMAEKIRRTTKQI